METIKNNHHEVQILINCGDNGQKAIFRSIFNPETCESYLNSASVTDENGKFRRWDSIDLLWRDHPEDIASIKRDLQNAVCFANGHCGCNCPNACEIPGFVVESVA